MTQARNLGIVFRSENAMRYEPVSFKRVFLYVTTMIMSICFALMLYVGVSGVGANETVAPTLPYVPPTPSEDQILYTFAEPATLPLLPEQTPALEPVWPSSLTYHEAKTNPDYYLAWLQAKNPGVTFKAVKAVVTGYCPCSICCGSGAHGVTRTGVHTSIEPYGIAAPEALVRRLVHIPGYMFESEPGKVWKTDDTGSALNDDWSQHVYHFDVRFTSHDWAKHWWGRREMTVYIAKHVQGN